MTPQQLRDTADAMEAFAKGEPIQMFTEGASWPEGPWTTWNIKGAPNWLHNPFRPKPVSKARPWAEAVDVPGPVCWLRFKRGDGSYSDEHLIVRVADVALWAGADNTLPIFWEKLGTAEHSIDRKTWLPCVVEE